MKAILVLIFRNKDNKIVERFYVDINDSLKSNSLKFILKMTNIKPLTLIASLDLDIIEYILKYLNEAGYSVFQLNVTKLILFTEKVDRKN